LIEGYCCKLSDLRRQICNPAPAQDRHGSAALLARQPRCYPVVSKRKKTMQGPEDDAGLAGKVVLVSGGGAAGDGRSRAHLAFYCAVLRVRATMKIDNEPYYKEVLVIRRYLTSTRCRE
jgi:hypothetical protein